MQNIISEGTDLDESDLDNIITMRNYEYGDIHNTICIFSIMHAQAPLMQHTMHDNMHYNMHI